jgi:hypothetical protein
MRAVSRPCVCLVSASKPALTGLGVSYSQDIHKGIDTAFHSSECWFRYGFFIINIGDQTEGIAATKRTVYLMLLRVRLGC